LTPMVGTVPQACAMTSKPQSTEVKELEAWQLLDSLLGEGPRVICAPMVLGSELAFRMLVRRHGVRLCYTPMLRARQLAEGAPEELRLLESCAEDRPLVVQLCGRDPELLAQAARRAVRKLPHLDAIDFNLGCPQECAELGRYGAFLQDEPGVTGACVRALCEAAHPKPVFCKTRILETPEASIGFAQLLVEAGCSLLALHCRLRFVKHDGPPNFEQLAAVCSALRIPVVANGGISSIEEIGSVMQRTGAAAAMVASELLRCPRAFAIAHGDPLTHPIRDCVDMALEYLHAAELYPPPSPAYIQKHLRWIFRAELEDDYRKLRSKAFEALDALRCENVDSSVRLAYDSKKWSWQACMWQFLNRHRLSELWQFHELIRLVAYHQGRSLPPWEHCPGDCTPSYHRVRFGTSNTSPEQDETCESLGGIFDEV